MNDDPNRRAQPVSRVCLEITSLLADQLSGGLEAGAARAVAAHLATCEACRETAAAVTLVRREDARGDDVDLWPRLRLHLRAETDEERLRLQFPAFTWRIAAALAAVTAAPLLVAEPVEFLALIVGLL